MAHKKKSGLGIFSAAFSTSLYMQVREVGLCCTSVAPLLHLCCTSVAPLLHLCTSLYMLVREVGLYTPLAFRGDGYAGTYLAVHWCIFRARNEQVKYSSAAVVLCFTCSSLVLYFTLQRCCTVCARNEQVKYSGAAVYSVSSLN